MLRIPIFSAAALILLTGCSAIQGSSEREALPVLTVTVDGNEYEAAVGPYCWTSGGTGECVDAAGEPFAYAERFPPVPAAASSEVMLAFDPAPDHWHVLEVREDGEENSVDSKPFVLPSEPGKYGYSVTGGWPQGDVTFFFIVEVRDPAD